MTRAIPIPELGREGSGEKRCLFMGYATLRRIAERTKLPFPEAFAKLYQMKPDGRFIIDAFLLTAFITAALHKEHPRKAEQYVWLGLTEDDVAALIDEYCAAGTDGYMAREAALLFKCFDAAYHAGLLPRQSDSQEENHPADPPQAVESTMTN